MLLRLAAAPRPSIRQLAAELGLAPSAVDHHLSRLASEGLLVRGRTLTLTPTGRTLAVYLQAQSLGVSVLRRLIRKHWGRYSRAAVSALLTVAAKEDETYAVCRGGLKRKTSRGPELERKAGARDILVACRKHNTLAAAAATVGLQGGALEQRVKALIAKARAL
jgi:DNA-binding MarR family transcriptional regulator